MEKNGRLYVLILILILLTCALIVHLFSLQILQHESYKNLADNQYQTRQILPPKRGDIFLKDRFYGKGPSSQLFQLAINRDWQMVYAVPKEISNKEETAKLLAPMLEIDEKTLFEKINKRLDPYEPLKHKVASDIANQIKQLNIKGIEVISESWRYYPNNNLASHVLGFVGFSENEDEKVGQYGIEGYYNKELAGEPGILEGEKDTQGRLMTVANNYLKPVQDGADLILTLDPIIQFFVEAKLKEVVEQFKAEGGAIIVMDSQTGAIKALTSWPSFDPNNYSAVKDINIFLNPVVSGIYEPGSIFKPITMAIALEKKLLTPNTVYEDKGFVKVANTIIRNSTNTVEGIQTMTQVLEKSLNTGAVFIEQLIGKKSFKEYLEKFGFSRKTKIDLGGEIRGNLNNLNTKGDVEYATASFGQGIAITPIELIAAFGAIANKGKMMKPYIVDKVIYKDGKETITKPQMISEVISPETAEKLTEMLVSVVENGHAKRAGIPGYFIAGKTGTAQVPNPSTGGYYSDKTIHSFGAFFPAFDPQFVVLLKLDNPQGIRFAESSVVPAFKDIAQYIINYYEIPPTRQ